VGERNRIVAEYSKVRFSADTFADSRTLNHPKYLKHKHLDGGEGRNRAFSRSNQGFFTRLHVTTPALFARTASQFGRTELSTLLGTAEHSFGHTSPPQSRS
jgi:hypothetical protein